MTPILETRDLTKHYLVPSPTKPASIGRRVRRFFVREWDPVVAVDHISFSVEPGESVAFLGPNGAGKTTTVKMLTGILTPTSGTARVAGFEPHRQRYAYTYHIGLVMGQKSMLVWDIPVIESLRLYRDVYELDDRQFEARLAQFAEMLEIDQLLHIPVRKLSLGQRMRAEIVSSLLHEPEIVFLDEPTVGLDLLSKRRMLDFIQRINQVEGVTVFMTTHNIPDVERVCRRVILIDKGQIIYDGSSAALADKSTYRMVEFECPIPLTPAQVKQALPGLACEKVGENGRYVVKVVAARVGEATQQISRGLPVEQVGVRRPDLEQVLGDIYEGKIQL
jgi:ABC-2 type transport system ATP-binding protein